MSVPIIFSPPTPPGDFKKVNCDAEISVSRLKRITAEIRGVSHVEKLYKRSLGAFANILAQYTEK